MNLEALRKAVSPGSLLTAEADLATYAYDAALDRGRPDAVVLAASTEEVQRVVRWCAREKVPFTARGAGTNLSGGCIPLQGGVVVSLARMNKILEIDTSMGFALVEPGTVNLNLQKELEKVGYFYAPDPASFKVSTIGGNIAENAGGPRCLKYGVTTNHVLALEVVMPDGSLEKFSLEDAGAEVMSLIVGAEGTLGVVTKAWVKILPIPENIMTFLAGFDSIEKAIDCVSAIVAKGIIPRVLEALDKTTVDSVEAYAHAGYPKTEAVLLIEVDGERERVLREAAEIEAICRELGCEDYRSAQDAAHREKLWEGRRGAYAAMARLAPNVLVEDGVVPRDRLPEIVRRIREISARHQIVAALLFHAGDGNIHPNIAYDEHDLEQTVRVKAAGHEILQACVELGGSLSGEHGIGVDKRDAMAWLFTEETLGVFRRVKAAFDPDNLANPDKLFPLTGARARPQRSYPRPQVRGFSAAAGILVERVRAAAAKGATMAILGAGTRSSIVAPGSALILETSGLREILELDQANQTLTVEAGIVVSELHGSLKEKGFYLRLPQSQGTLGGLLATKPCGGVRDDILGMRLLLADGTLAQLGGKVVKNVAGYDVPRLILGSWGTLGVILDLTLKVYASPQKVPPAGGAKPFAAGFWQHKIKRAFDPGNLLNPWFFKEGFAPLR